MTAEDDTFRVLSRPTYEQLNAIKPLVTGEDFFISNGWSWLEFRTEWIRRIKIRQDRHKNIT